MNKLNVFRTCYLLVTAIIISMLMVACGSSSSTSVAGDPAAVFSISGSVSGATDVTLNLTGAASATVQTDAMGYYSFANLANGDYTVSPVKTGFKFDKVSIAVTVSGANESGKNFVATADTSPTFGLSGTVTGAVQDGVLITLSSAGTVKATTNTSNGGKYNFNNLPNGSYTAAPSHSGYTFTPATATVTINGAAAVFTNFVSAAIPVSTTYNVTGTVTGDTLQGVTITLSGNAVAAITTTTDATGKYSFASVANGDYTVAPSKAGFTFTPASTTAKVSGADVTVSAFKATTVFLATYTLSGTVTGAVMKDVLITLSGASTATTTTNASGNYSFTGLTNGSYTAAATLAGYTFAPATQKATINGANATLGNFVSTAIPVTTYTISGTVASTVVGAATGVTINLTGAATAIATTDASGNYSFTGLSNGNYTVAPVKTGYSFNPSSTAVNVSGANVSGTNFTATSKTGTRYSLSGAVTGVVLKDVLITLSTQGSGQTLIPAATTYTNTTGNYSFPGLVNGTYTVTPKLAGYTFTPTSRPATINDANATLASFVSTVLVPPTYTISGNVTGANLQGQGGMQQGAVTVNLTGAATKTTTTDQNGYYSFTGIANGDYTVTPVRSGLAFTPASSSVIVSGANASQINFTAAVSVVPTYTLSGTVTGAVTQNVLITLTGVSSATTTTNASGNFSFSGLPNGGYTVTPSLAGYTFTPAAQAATIAGANVNLGTFVSGVIPTVTYTISGKVVGAVLAGVSVQLTGAATMTAITDATGNYSFANLTNGNYTISPVLAGMAFNPTSVAVNVTNANVTVPDFTASISTITRFNLSGNVIATGTGTGIPSVLISLTGAGNATTITNASGNYSFASLSNGTYTITPSRTGFTFTPVSVQVTVNGVDVIMGAIVGTATGGGD